MGLFKIYQIYSDISTVSKFIVFFYIINFEINSNIFIFKLKNFRIFLLFIENGKIITCI